MSWQLISIALAASGLLLLGSLHLHRSGQTRPAKIVDAVALAWLFVLVQFFFGDTPLLMGAMMFLGCFHLALLMEWLPIRRTGR